MITLRPYQTRAVQALLTTKRGIVQAPAGSGKTIIAAAALEMWLEESGLFLPGVIWLANTREQCEQAEEAIELFPEIKNYCDVSIGCYVGVDSCAGADLVILDECHHIAAPTIRKCLKNYTGALWGISATPNRADDFRKDVFDLIGPIVCAIERNELVSAGNLSKAHVIFHTPNFYGEFEEKITGAANPVIKDQIHRFRFKSPIEITHQVTWRFAQDIGVFNNEKRNNSIQYIARSHSKDSVLIIVGSVKHGEDMASKIKDSVLVHSKLGIKIRRQAIEDFRSGKIHCLIATSLADEGLDVPRANVLILAAGGRSAAKAEQRTGRVLRSFVGKEHGLIHDFWDQQHYFLLAQSKARKKIYENLDYKVEFEKIAKL